jgi:AcrR family transcriptional regulator
MADLTEAGEQLFFEKGYHNTTMEDIARRADYAVGTLYRYFPSKESLFEELLYGKMMDYCRQWEKVFEDLSNPLTVIRSAVRMKLEFFEKERRFFRLFVEEINPMEAGAHTSVFSERCHALREKCRSSWHRLIRRGIRLGVFGKVDVHLSTVAIEGAMHEVIRDFVLRHPQRPLLALKDFLRELIERILKKP